MLKSVIITSSILITLYWFEEVYNNVIKKLFCKMLKKIQKNTKKWKNTKI